MTIDPPAAAARLTAAAGNADNGWMSAVPTTAARVEAESLALPRALVSRLALPLVFVAAATYHFLQSRGHATPTVFNDELLYAKLSQAIAAGHGLEIRGEHFYFPAPLAPLVQAPAWLLGSMTDAYAAAKLLNAVVMSSAVFPAYWIARRVVRHSYALLTAVAAVASPALVYHAYLMSEALAYPVFLVAVAVLARAVARPSRWTALVVPLTCATAVATRVQFLVLPLAYLVAVAVCARGSYRRHVLPAGVTALFVAVVVGVPGALGQYGEATHLGYAPGDDRALDADERLPAPVLARDRDRPGRALRARLHARPAAQRVRTSTRHVRRHDDGAVRGPGGSHRRRRGVPPARALRLLRHAAPLPRLLRVRGTRRTAEARVRRDGMRLGDRPLTRVTSGPDRNGRVLLRLRHAVGLRPRLVPHRPRRRLPPLRRRPDRARAARLRVAAPDVAACRSSSR